MRKTKLGALFVIILVLIVIPLWKWRASIKQDETIKIVTSFPMRGITVGKSIVNGITLALEEVGYKAGEYKINLAVEDGGDENGKWSEDIERDIATRASADPDVMAYLGTYNSGSAKISIPITNKAGLAQISPGNTWPGLTQPGFLPGEPGIFYPTGVRNYFRVVPNDAMQAPAGAIWAKELGATSIYILNDGTPPAKIEATIARKASEIDLKVVGRSELKNTSDGIAVALKDVKKTKADILYFAGITTNGAVPLIKGLRAQTKTVKFMGLDGILDQTFIDQAGSAAEGAFITSVGVPSSQITNPAGKEFVEKYRARFKTEPEIFSAFGYESAKVALLAIGKAGVKDRTKILTEVANIKDYDGLFGKWSFDQNGDTTLTLVSGNIVKDGEFAFDKVLNQ
jgi:branched-chain amino acid transport system substrate-binding protein